MEKVQKEKRVKLNVTIDPEIKESLLELAAREGRDVSWIVCEAMRDYMKRLGRELPTAPSDDAVSPDTGQRK